MPHLDQYLALGIDSLKVEGRNKSVYYVAVVARIYRKAMDDWERDPDNWSPQSYMNELMNVSNRGYTLAFHDGRLTNYAHNYEQTQTLGEWEFAGFVCANSDDGVHVEVKNKLVSGDVLEFLPPDGGDTILLRVYEFESAANGKITQEVHAGTKPVIKIPFSAFDHEDAERLKARLPELTVVRKETPLTQTQWDRLKLDRVGQRLEVTCNTHDPVHPLYEKKRAALRNSLREDNKTRKIKSPRLGLDTCCGRGCNGCLMFWHDPAYEKARAIMARKKQGETLDRDMRQNAESRSQTA